MNIFYLTWLVAGLSFFDCERVGDIQTLNVNPTITCDTPEHIQRYGIGVFILIAYAFLFPVLLFLSVIIVKFRAKKTFAEVSTQFGTLFIFYKPKYHFLQF
jgi:hypothetical protein